MRFSRKTDYSLVFLGVLKDAYKNKKMVTVREVSDEYDIPYSFLEKVASDLKNAGLIQSQKGRDGGYMLTKNPKDISLQDVMDIFERPKMVRYLDGANKESMCMLSDKCPTRKRWEVIDKKISKIFEESTLAEL